MLKLADWHTIARAKVHIEDGHAPELLPGFANGRNADIVTMGAAPRSQLRHALLGDTAQRTPCPPCRYLDRHASGIPNTGAAAIDPSCRREPRATESAEVVNPAHPRRFRPESHSSNSRTARSKRGL